MTSLFVAYMPHIPPGVAGAMHRKLLFDPFRSQFRELLPARATNEPEGVEVCRRCEIARAKFKRQAIDLGGTRGIGESKVMHETLNELARHKKPAGKRLRYRFVIVPNDPGPRQYLGFAIKHDVLV